MRYIEHPSKSVFNIKSTRHFVKYVGYAHDIFTCSEIPNIFQHCLESCANNATIEMFDRVSHDLDVTSHYNYKNISKTQISDSNISVSLDNIMDEYLKMCNI